jgi:hypothetical protein
MASFQAFREQAHALSVVPQHFEQPTTPNDIQHTDRNLLSSNIGGIRSTASDCASTNDRDAEAKRSCISKSVPVYLARSRHGCVTPRRVRQCWPGRHRLELRP